MSAFRPVVKIHHDPAQKREARFVVYEWCQSLDAGTLIGRFSNRLDAVAFAHGWAGRNDCEVEL